MTDKTEALPPLLERAIAALMECDRDGDYPLIADLEAAIAALTAAPSAQAEPQEPPAQQQSAQPEQQPVAMRVVMVGACQKCGHEHEFPDRALAWVALGYKGSQVPVQATTDEPTALRWSKAGGDVVPTYAAATQPRAVEPLTPLEAIGLWKDRSDGPSNAEIVSYCRAIERAHGIGKT